MVRCLKIHKSFVSRLFLLLISLWILECSPGFKVIKLFSCSTQFSIKFIMLINVKMPATVGIYTFISMVNTAIESVKGRIVLIIPPVRSI